MQTIQRIKTNLTQNNENMQKCKNTKKQHHTEHQQNKKVKINKTQQIAQKMCDKKKTMQELQKKNTEIIVAEMLRNCREDVAGQSRMTFQKQQTKTKSVRANEHESCKFQQNSISFSQFVSGNKTHNPILTKTEHDSNKSCEANQSNAHPRHAEMEQQQINKN